MYFFIILTIVYNLILFTNGSVAPVTKKIRRLKLSNNNFAPINPENQQINDQNNYNQENIHRNTNPHSSKSRFSTNRPFWPPSLSANHKEAIDAYLNLRPAVYVERFGSKTPDFDQYTNNMEILQAELAKKTK